MLFAYLTVLQRQWINLFADQETRAFIETDNWILPIVRQGIGAARLCRDLAATRRRIWFPIYTASPQ